MWIYYTDSISVVVVLVLLELLHRSNISVMYVSVMHHVLALVSLVVHVIRVISRKYNIVGEFHKTLYLLQQRQPSLITVGSGGDGDAPFSDRERGDEQDDQWCSTFRDAVEFVGCESRSRLRQWQSAIRYDIVDVWD